MFTARQPLSSTMALQEQPVGVGAVRHRPKMGVTFLSALAELAFMPEYRRRQARKCHAESNSAAHPPPMEKAPRRLMTSVIISMPSQKRQLLMATGEEQPLPEVVLGTYETLVKL